LILRIRNERISTAIAIVVAGILISNAIIEAGSEIASRVAQAVALGTFSQWGSWQCCLRIIRV